MSQLPGFKAPLVSGKPIYPSLEDDFNSQLLTLREIDMMRAMNAVTDKPGWETKVCHTAFPSLLCSVPNYQKHFL